MFDVSLGKDYPHRPPQVQFLTTSSFLSQRGKHVRFNPNLYEGGKVCLSLLGTWDGPGWEPGVSTLLQVLVSLQALILGNPEPYFNEPGFESSKGTAYGNQASNKYNRDIRRYTLEVAILPFLQNELNQKGKAPKDPLGSNVKNMAYFTEFEEVLRQHFRLKQSAIQKQLYKWLQEDSSLQSLYQEYWNVWERLKKLTDGNKKPAARGTKRKSFEAPGVKEHADGVIEIDGNDDVQAVFDAEMETALRASLGDKVPELSVAGRAKISKDTKQDEDNDQKPCANKKRENKEPSGVTQHTDGIIEIDDDDDDDDDDDYKADIALAMQLSVVERGPGSNQGSVQLAENGIAGRGQVEGGGNNGPGGDVHERESHIKAAAAAAAEILDLT